MIQSLSFNSKQEKTSFAARSKNENDVCGFVWSYISTSFGIFKRFQYNSIGVECVIWWTHI